mmetsp:Transcript_5277/g.15665  ORF Transcript_5277/g.15665 Transcript_5277/m.15665 type:complete len:175 (-) Transcript_5277:27-551(-)
MDFFNLAKDVMKQASDEVNQRVATAQAGKRLLDEGGPDAEQKIAAKANCRRTVQSDRALGATLADVVRQYEEAGRELNRALASSACTPEERYDFQQLLGLYEQRATDFKKAAAAVSALPPPAPFISAQEEDAIKILWARGQVRTAQERATEVSRQAEAAGAQFAAAAREGARNN